MGNQMPGPSTGLHGGPAPGAAAADPWARLGRLNKPPLSAFKFWLLPLWLPGVFLDNPPFIISSPPTSPCTCSVWISVCFVEFVQAVLLCACEWRQCAYSPCQQQSLRGPQGHFVRWVAVSPFHYRSLSPAVLALSSLLKPPGWVCANDRVSIKNSHLCDGFRRLLLTVTIEVLGLFPLIYHPL